MKNGFQPMKVYHRNFSYERTFGALAVPFPSHYSCDNGKTMPDQNADANYYECTDYTTRDIAMDADGIEYATGYLYAKTLLMLNFPASTEGLQITDVLKASRVYGLLPLDKAPSGMIGTPEFINADYRKWPTDLDIQAGYHRNGQYFDVDKVGDYFDGFLNALYNERANKRSLSLGTPWFPEWLKVGSDGVLAMPVISKGLFTGLFGRIFGRILGSLFGGSSIPWHNYKCPGWTDRNTSGQLIRNGEMFLMIKSWQGRNVGDKGWVYMPREVANAVFDIYGTAAIIPARATVDDIQLVKLSALDTLLSYYFRMLQILQKQLQAQT